MSRFFFGLVAASILCGCRASMVTPPGGAVSMKNAPVNEASRPGVVRYLNQGASTVIKKRRQDAYNQMTKACSGSYAIDSESEKEDGSSTTDITATRTGVQADTYKSKYWYIAFHCVKADSPPRGAR